MKIQNQIFLAVVLGLVVGILLNVYQIPPEYYSFLDWMGKLFIRMLKMITVPLIVASLIVGVTTLKTTEKLRAMGIKTIVYYLATTTIAVTLGLVLVNLIQPGVGVENFVDSEGVVPAFERKSIGNMILEFVPVNIFSSLVEMQFIPIILFSLVLGVLITSFKGKAQPVEDLFLAKKIKRRGRIITP